MSLSPAARHTQQSEIAADRRMEALGVPDSIPISLGYNCFVRVFFQEFLKATARYPFDWAGTPMWAICELMDADFAEFCPRERLTPRKRFTDDDEIFLTNTRYNMVFQHDYGKDHAAIPRDTYKRVTEEYGRRIQRWRDALAGSQQLLFFRLEASERSRSEYEGSVRPKTESEYLWEFTDKLKTRGANYHIIYITHTQPQGYDAERKIINLNYTPKKAGMVVMGRHIDAIVAANRKFIKSCITGK